MPAGFQIKVRNLETDETLIATLDSYEDALTFLADRPHLMEVITVLSDVSTWLAIATLRRDPAPVFISSQMGMERKQARPLHFACAVADMQRAALSGGSPGDA